VVVAAAQTFAEHVLKRQFRKHRNAGKEGEWPKDN
jgi:hypothetical protein